MYAFAASVIYPKVQHSKMKSTSLNIKSLQIIAAWIAFAFFAAAPSLAQQQGQPTQAQFHLDVPSEFSSGGGGALPPAFYTMEEGKTPPPVATPTPSEEKSDPFAGRAAIEGKVIGFDGTLNVYLMKPVEGSDRDIETTWQLQYMPDQTFKKDGIDGGRYFLRFEDPALLIRPIEFQIQIHYIEPTVLELDFNGLVRIAGDIKVNGQAVRAELLSLGLLPNGNGRLIPRFLPCGEHQVEAFVKPGNYKPVLFHEFFGLRTIFPFFDITPQMNNQVLNFDVPLTEVQLNIVSPKGYDPKRGEWVFEFRTWNWTEERKVPVSQPSVPMYGMLKGDYFVEYRAPKDGVYGHSPVVQVDYSKKNIINVPLAKKASHNYEVVVNDVPPGTYEYKFYSEPDDWFLDKLNPNSKGSGSMMNSVFTVPKRNPNAPIPNGWPQVNPATGDVKFRLENVDVESGIFVLSDFNDWSLDPGSRMLPVDILSQYASENKSTTQANANGGN